MTATTVIHSDPSGPKDPGLRARVSSRLLGGNTSIHEGLLGPNELVPPHTHAREDQCLYVVSGTVHLEVGGQFVEAKAGTYVIKPRGVPHALWNPCTTPSLVLEITSPGGFESFYDEMAMVDSPAEAEAVKEKHGITFHPERLSELVERYDLQIERPMSLEQDSQHPPTWAKR